ncbi:hypothetical protein ACLIAG_000097 [Enterobacter hormaechei]|uniref:Uncharacterized protein n=1 Tax=Enterobacter hormaechei TaxID=158836 RepID=A0A6G4LLH6_9ENTR|nr:hypothetical protein [Enterobacter hormaechei]MCG0494494.1 hypothetical protein [Enterobacter hormaechei]MCG0535186.1 hypothetical protein [Enterobacter hormaechei]MCG0549366.1 hypothetical protein [Enterobacter hormaechei]MCG0554008.1 hypothetical protein [Enterobacter hormaechei]MCG0566694.1 hypothetical protein [Enterobacter hormaechei]
MNEQANKILVDLLQKASNGIDAAVSFSQAQVPDVIHQLLVWSSVQSALCQAFGLLFLIGAMKLPVFARRARKNGEKWTAHDGKPNDGWFISSFSYDMCTLMAPIAGTIIGILMVALNFDWLKIWLAPKIYLIEYAASLVK